MEGSREDSMDKSYWDHSGRWNCLSLVRFKITSIFAKIIKHERLKKTLTGQKILGSLGVLEKDLSLEW